MSSSNTESPRPPTALFLRFGAILIIFGVVCAIMSNMWGHVVCATGIWLIFGMALFYEHAGRSGGDRWAVTASEKIASRPALARVHVPTTTPIVR
ncbi:MAG: hypothetical protein K0R61_293 [Microvirga sp.]|jgi:hypothetical protein|nr:hypothetical protein [Microvirga sp.]MDF2969843.1 hypothetical protein [Microvirga sp.]